MAGHIIFFLLSTFIFTFAQDANNGEEVFRWVNVVEVAGQGRRIRVYGRSSNFPDFGTGQNNSFATFYGLPFALSPSNHLRFQRPSLRVLDKDFQAMTPPQPCPQLNSAGEFIGNEDCLMLNIYMPMGGNEDEPLPVLVWLHGESPENLGRVEVLNSGSAMDLDPSIFMGGSVVVVTPQYRLGTLGFVNTVNEDLNGNIGLFDQLMALEWIQRFISFFRGDPKQVTLMGFGGSAMTAGILATTELARGFFQRAILMSGSPLSPLSLDTTPKITFAEIALQNSCPSFPSSHFVRCMQSRKVQNIVKADQRLAKKSLPKIRLPLPVVQKEADGRFVPPLIFRSPETTLKEGAFEPIPIIIGVTTAELSGYLSSAVGAETPEEVRVLSSPNVLQQYFRSLLGRWVYPAMGMSSNSGHDPSLPPQLVTFEYFAGLNITERAEQARDLLEEVLSDFVYFVPALYLAELWSKHAPVYFYVFDHAPLSASPDAGPSLASHGSDFRLLNQGLSSQHAVDRELSSVLISLFTNFVHKGSPLNAGVEWPAFRADDSRQFLSISPDGIEVGKNFRNRQYQFWRNILPKAISASGSGNCPKVGSGSLSATSSKRSGPLLYKDVDVTALKETFFTLGFDGHDDKRKENSGKSILL